MWDSWWDWRERGGTSLYEESRIGLCGFHSRAVASMPFPLFCCLFMINIYIVPVPIFPMYVARRVLHGEVEGLVSLRIRKKSR